MVYKLYKALYGLRQAPRAWNIRLDKELKQLGFCRCPQEPAVYKQVKVNSLLLVGIYVDDLIVTGTREEDISMFKQQMKEIFDMSDLGRLSYYLGIEVQQGKDGIMVRRYYNLLVWEIAIVQSTPWNPNSASLKTYMEQR